MLKVGDKVRIVGVGAQEGWVGVIREDGNRRRGARNPGEAFCVLITAKPGDQSMLEIDFPNNWRYYFKEHLELLEARPVSRECPCGIFRGDCTYHKDGVATLSEGTRSFTSIALLWIELSDRHPGQLDRNRPVYGPNGPIGFCFKGGGTDNAARI